MNLVYVFCADKSFDVTDKDNVRRYCNLYMADYTHKSSLLFNKMMEPINSILEQAKKDFKKDK